MWKIYVEVMYTAVISKLTPRVHQKLDMSTLHTYINVLDIFRNVIPLISFQNHISAHVYTKKYLTI